MPRKVKDQALDSREARGKLKARDRCYWRAVNRGAHVGYRRIAARNGTWWGRFYAGEQRYDVEAIGAADDQATADGSTTFDFWQAVDRVRARAAARARGDVVEPVDEDRDPDASYTVANAMRDYLRAIRHKRSHRNTVWQAGMIDGALGHIALANLTTKRINRWAREMVDTPPRIRTKEGEKPRHGKLGTDEESIRKRQVTANRMISLLKSALNNAWREGEVASDDAWRRVKRFPGARRARQRFLDVEECRRLINGASPEFRPLVEAGLRTGARYQEIAKTRVRDFNATRGTLHIETGKNGQPRDIILNDEGIALFSRLTAGRAGSDLIFTRNNGEPWRESNQKQRMKDAFRNGRVDPIGFHGLRHTFISHAVMAGTPYGVISKSIGATVAEIFRTYAHLLEDHEKQAMRAGALKLGALEPGNVTAMRRR